jgi:phosphonate transport system permease protein
MKMPPAVNPPYRLPPPLFDARCRACWFVAGLMLLVVASFWSLDLQWAQFFSLDAAQSMGRFVGEFFPPDTSPAFVQKVAVAAWETLAMSALGTLLAAVAGLALALHTTGVLGRLFAEAMENAPPGPGAALRAQGVGNGRVVLYATLPQVLPQLMSYALYRWENNIRAAAVLGVVGAGGLGQLLAFHMGLFHMPKTATILGAMLLLVAVVDAASLGARRWMTR